MARLLSIVALLVLAAMTAPRAGAQNVEPKVEAPEPAPPAIQDGPKRATPPAPPVQTKDSAPDQTQKGAPTAPAEKQKAAPSAPSDAPLTPAPAPAVAADRAAVVDAAEALSTRYKFVERYGLEENPARPELITQYRVGVRETTKFVREKAQAAPERSERSRTSIYVERAAKVNRLGEATDLMRRYDLVRLKDLVPARPLDPPFLQGLTIWYHRRLPMRPQVLSLTPDRRLREDEYTMIAEELSIPQLVSFFPAGPKRVSDTWAIPPGAVRDVSGEMPDGTDFDMTGTLLKVSKGKDSNSLVAEIGVSGQFNLVAGPSSFNARIYFTFEPRGVALPAPGAEATAKVVEAAGRISQALLSHAAASSLPDGGGRLKVTVTNELILERRPLALLPGERGGPVAGLALPPDPLPPPATEANSWVVYNDPEGRFHFEHPQELRQPPQIGSKHYRIDLVDNRQSGDWVLVVLLPSKSGDRKVEQRFRDPAALQKSLEAEWSDDQLDVTRGSAGWLDDADWKGAKRRVYRIEAALKKKGAVKPIYGDFYLVEFSPTQTIMVYSFTERPDHVAYRNQAEDVIKSFHFGPFEKRTRTPSATPSDSGTNPAGGGAPPATPAAPPAAPGAPPQ